MVKSPAETFSVQYVYAHQSLDSLMNLWGP